MYTNCRVATCIVVVVVAHEKRKPSSAEVAVTKARLAPNDVSLFKAAIEIHSGRSHA